MKKPDILQTACALLLGWAAAAAGGGIPVHRDYVRPVLIVDEAGPRTMADGDAPDRTARQVLRNTQAQEALMGRETLMEMTLNPGQSVFGVEARGAGRPASLPRDTESPRRRTGESGRDWLVQSLPLPTLGQGDDPTARSAMSGAPASSGWGWLADDVSTPEEWQPADAASGEGLPPTDMEAAMQMDSVNPFGQEPTARRPTEDSAPATAAAFPTRPDGGGRPVERTTDRSVESARGRLTAAEAAGPGPQASRVTVPAPAEMTQTRQMLAGISGRARPDMAGWRGAGDSGGNIRPRQESAPVAGQRVGLARPAGDPAWSGWGAKLPTTSDRLTRAAPAPARSTWQGGWSAQPMRSGLSPRLEMPTDSGPAVRTPLSTRGMPPPRSGAGAKPAWQ
jgi:hypothetical protein